MEEEEEINLDKPSAYLEFRQVLILFIFFFLFMKICFFIYFLHYINNIHLIMKTKNNRVINSILYLSKNIITKSTAGWAAAVI